MAGSGQVGAGAGQALLRRLAGRWTVLREIEDRRAGTRGRFEGVADFAPGPGGPRAGGPRLDGPSAGGSSADGPRADGPGPGGLGYREAGTLHLPGQPAFAAERRYLWRADGDRVIVTFDDGRPFHAFDARLPRPEAGHACPPDRYAVVYDFTAWPEWGAVWSVRGPRKDHVLRARYRKA